MITKITKTAQISIDCSQGLARSETMINRGSLA